MPQMAFSSLHFAASTHLDQAQAQSKSEHSSPVDFTTTKRVAFFNCRTLHHAHHHPLTKANSIFHINASSGAPKSPADYFPPSKLSNVLDENLTADRFGLNRWGEGIRIDLERRWYYYKSDWTDVMRRPLKVVAALFFMFFACLAPIIAFGALTAVLTDGAFGVIEFILSSLISGSLYALTCGQPLTIIAPTGLTLTFTAALSTFCKSTGVSFLTAYSWIGIHTSFILAILALANVSDFIRYCTRFTDDIFNSMIVTNFLFEAIRSILCGFSNIGPDKTAPFLATTLAFSTFILSRALVSLRNSKLFNKKIRTFFADFGPSISIVSMTAVSCLPAVSKYPVERLKMPATFQLAENRALLMPLLSAPLAVKAFTFIPAILVVCLMYLDQNISVRVVNKHPDHPLKKPPAYHLDLFALSIATLISSIFGLPWLCGATVQSLNHARALTEFEPDEKTHQETPVHIVENRFTGFAINILIGCSLFFIPLLRLVPMGVIFGLFLFLGVNMVHGNDFIRRIGCLFVERKLLDPNDPLLKVRPMDASIFTGVQILCLILMWIVKLDRRTSMYFPLVIGSLMMIRSFVLPKLIPSKAIEALDGGLV